MSRMAEQRPTNRPPARPLNSRPRRGFTLIELMVVVGIIILVVAVATPAIGPMLASNESSQAVSALSGLLTLAQLRSEQGNPVALRIERAFETDADGVMIPNANGVPRWEDHQQIRMVIRDQSSTSGLFEDVEDANGIRSPVVVNLPAGAWVAPVYSLDFDLSETSEDMDFDVTDVDDVAVNINPFETFYVCFSGQGELERRDAGSIRYSDRTQAYGGNPTFPEVDHPHDSARALLLYDRRKWKNIADPASRLAFLQTQCRILYISRMTGAIVEGRGQ